MDGCASEMAKVARDVMLIRLSLNDLSLPGGPSTLLCSSGVDQRERDSKSGDRQYTDDRIPTHDIFYSCWNR
jgi:hypothetical protein